MTPREFRLHCEGMAERVKREQEHELQLTAQLACWIVNLMPVPFIRLRKKWRAKQLLGGAEGFAGTKEEFRAEMRARQRRLEEEQLAG